MNDRDLVQKLKAIKAEVLALKQSYEIGLNRTDFDYRYINQPISLRVIQYRLTIEFSSVSTSQPYFEIFSEGAYAYYGMAWEQNNRTIRISGVYICPSPDTPYIAELGIVSSAPIKTLTFEDLGWQ